MSVHTVIESLSAYEAVRKGDPKGDRVWWSTSPYLLMHLPERGEVMKSPENDLPQERLDALGRLTYDLSWEICGRLNRLCQWLDFVDLRMTLAQALQRTYLPILYKGLLLSRVQDEASGSVLVVVGDPQVREADLMPQFGRFDTVFALLAQRMGLPVIRHVMDFEHLRRMDAAVTKRPLGRAETVLSLLTNTLGTFAVKLWRALHRHGIPPDLLGLPGGQRFWVFKDNELLDQSLIPLLLRGARVGHLPELRPPAISASPDPLPDEAVLAALFRDLFETQWQAQAAPEFAARAACLDLLLERTLGSLRALRSALPGLTAQFADLARKVRSGDVVLTNLLSGAVEFSFYCWLRNRDIPVISFEHGLTLGLSRIMDWEARYASVRAGTLGVYHSRAAMQAVASFTPGQEQVLAGLPAVARRVPLRLLSRRLARRVLGLGMREHVVMLVADLDRNNAIHAPHAENDWQFLVKTRTAISRLSAAFPASRVVVKLYPTQRYVDRYSFTDLAADLPNLRLVQDMDFRFIRAAADLVFVSNAQSTLGWVAGAGCPALFLEYPWAPVRLPGLALGETGAAEDGRAILLDRGRLLEDPEPNWLGRLLGHRRC